MIFLNFPFSGAGFCCFGDKQKERKMKEAVIYARFPSYVSSSFFFNTYKRYHLSVFCFFFAFISESF